MWQEPKTDWTADDYFNYTDYNRIKNNIAYLREIALKLFIDFSYDEMGEDKTSYAQYPYADEFTLMENNLEYMREITLLLDESEKKEWYDNQKTPNYEDFNRLEKACLLFYNGFNAIKNNKSKLSFRFGAYKSIKI